MNRRLYFKGWERAAFDAGRKTQLRRPALLVEAASYVQAKREDSSRPLDCPFAMVGQRVFVHGKHGGVLIDITGIRLERVQVISESDALAEGADEAVLWPMGDDGKRAPKTGKSMLDSYPSAKHAFRDQFDKDYGEGSWADNYVVWVIEFKPAS